MNATYQSMRQGLIDVIKESQIKIGFSPNPVKLYYPPASLAAALGTGADGIPEVCPGSRSGSAVPGRADRAARTAPA